MVNRDCIRERSIDNQAAMGKEVIRVVAAVIEHEGRYLAVASKGGHPEPPKWYWNIRKNPHVELQDGPVKSDYLARELSGEERTEWCHD